MGGKGTPSRGVSVVIGRRGSLPIIGIPNSRSDLCLYHGGPIVQSRWYDSEGKALRNRDYDHQDAHHTHEFPHDHQWIWDDGKPIRI